MNRLLSFFVVREKKNVVHETFYEIKDVRNLRGKTVPGETKKKLSAMSVRGLIQLGFG